jgi:hypothetical protein
MRKVSALLIAALVALAPTAQPLQAQDKAADVLAKMRQAIGGGKLESLKTFSIVGKTARNVGERQMTTDIELYLELPDKYLRVDNITAPIARTMQSGFNGDKPILPQGMNAAGGPVMIMNGAPMAAGGGGGMRVMTEMVVAGGGGTRGAGPGEANANVTPEMRNAQMIRSQRIELSRMMLGWFGMAHPGLNATYTYAGEAESPDGKAHIIGIKADGGFEAKLFIDQASNMPLFVSWQALEPIRLQNTGRTGGAGPVVSNTPPPPPPPPPAAAGGAVHTIPTMPQQAQQPQQGQMSDEMRKQLDEAMKNRKMIEYRVYFGDWKEVGGIQFPHSLQRATGNDTTEEWTISKVQVNPKIDAKKFQ